MLEYYLTKLSEGSFVFQIEDQGDRLTNYILSKPGKYYQARNGWKVAIDREPAIDIDRKVIYLRGTDHDADTRPATAWGLKSKECKNIVNGIHDAIVDVVQAAKNWKVSRPVFEEVVEIRRGYDPLGPLFDYPGIVIIKHTR